jgi:hypothetical protein
MRLVRLGVGVLLLAPCLLWLGRLPVRAEDPPAKAEKPARSPDDKPIPLGAVTGVIQSFGESNRELVLRYSYHYLEADPNAQARLVRQQQQILQRQTSILRIANPAQRQRQLAALQGEVANLMRTQGQLFKVKEVSGNLKVTLAEDAKIRTVAPPEEYDDKGNLKRHTAEELKKLRASDPGPGYPASFEVLARGRGAMVNLVRRAASAGAKESSLEKDKAGNDLIATIVLVAPYAPAK